MDQAISYLKRLSSNNNREWFNDNKKEFESIKSYFEEFSQLLISGISVFDSSISELKPKDTMFRIYRDIRFSKDKTPYKTNMGLFFVPGGKKSNNAGYYLHIEPGNSFVGGGNHMPQADSLKKIREEIFSNPQEFKNILEDKQFQDVFGNLQGDRLSRPPKGFDPDFEDIEFLKFKSFTVFQKLSDTEVLSKDLLNNVIEKFRIMKDFNAFLNKAIS